MSHKALTYLIITAIALGIVSVLLFFYGGSSFTESKVILKLDGPTQASVGDEVVYKVHYENQTKTTLHNIKLSFTYPDTSVIVQDGNIINNPGNVQTVSQPDITPGSLKDLEFHSFLIGDKGNIKIAKVKLAFDAGDLKSPFEKKAQLATTISDVPILLTLIGPPTTVSGQTVTYILDYRNQSADDISGLQLIMTYPDGFKPVKISPTPSSGNTVWSLPLLKKGAGKRITIQGTLSGREGDSKLIGVALKRNINDTYIDYEKTSVTTVIASPLLSVNTTINNSSDYISHAGDTLQYAVRYSNTSNFTFSGLILAVKLEGSMFDFSSIDPRGGFYDSSTRTITWNSTAIPAFDSFQPRATGTTNFSVKLNANTIGGGSNSLFAHATVQLVTQNVPDTISADEISVTDDILTKITSQPTFRQTMYYNDTAFASTGPMPPQAGKDTAFTVHWQIVNPGNALNNTKITAVLPQGITWKNVVSVGADQPQPTFNKNTSQVLWNIGTLPAGVGVAGAAAYELVFQVNIRPSTTQIGQPALVLSGSSLSGIDSFTQQNIVVNNLDLTTNSTVDQAGFGVVQ